MPQFFCKDCLFRSNNCFFGCSFQWNILQQQQSLCSFHFSANWNRISRCGLCTAPLKWNIPLYKDSFSLLLVPSSPLRIQWSYLGLSQCPFWIHRCPPFLFLVWFFPFSFRAWFFLSFLQVFWSFLFPLQIFWFSHFLLTFWFVFQVLSFLFLLQIFWIVLSLT